MAGRFQRVLRKKHPYEPCKSVAQNEECLYVVAVRGSWDREEVLFAHSNSNKVKLRNWGSQFGVLSLSLLAYSLYDCSNLSFCNEDDGRTYPIPICKVSPVDVDIKKKEMPKALQNSQPNGARERAASPDDVDIKRKEMPKAIQNPQPIGGERGLFSSQFGVILRVLERSSRAEVTLQGTLFSVSYFVTLREEDIGEHGDRII
ncbi:hypothetical protein SDJN02_06462, partial [Cucurbita argyrosperma subsp. argyrosperma]